MIYLLNYFKILPVFTELELYKIEFNTRIQFKSQNFIVQSIRKLRPNTVFFFDHNELFCIGEPDISKEEIQELDLFEKLNIADIKLTLDKVVKFSDIEQIETIHKVILAQIIATKFRKEGYIVRDKNNVFEVNIVQKRDSNSSLTINSGYEYQVVWKENIFYLNIDVKSTLIEELKPNYTLELINNGKISKGSRIVEYCPIYDCTENQTPYSRCRSGTFPNPLIFNTYFKRNNPTETPIIVDFIGCPTNKISEQFETNVEPHVVVGKFYNSDTLYNYHLKRISLSTSERVYSDEDQNIIYEGIFKSPHDRKIILDEFIQIANSIMLKSKIELSFNNFLKYENCFSKLTHGTKITYQNDVKNIYILKIGEISLDKIKKQMISLLKEINKEFWDFKSIEIEDLKDLKEGSSVICLLDNASQKLEVKNLRVQYHTKNISFQRFTYANYNGSSHQRSYLKNVIYQWYAKTGNTRDIFKQSTSRLVLSWETMILNKQYYLLLALYSTDGVLQKTKYMKLSKSNYKNNTGTLIIDFIGKARDGYEDNPIILKKGFFYPKQDEVAITQLINKNYILVEISSGNSRILLEEGRTISNPKIGTCIKFSKIDYIIITTEPSNTKTTAQPLKVTFQSQYTEEEIKNYINDIFQLTMAHTGYTFEKTKMPIPVYATSQIAKFIRFDSTKFLDTFESDYPYYLGD